ncbi:cation diffusion facilitator family transporter [Pseudanabaena sp. ABRG5-3]|uniref:cation diffusion facilitator family transporter n=1 Tax=Pseudanabaena sp. ABRG5-3 TaxID=685565 RepID=UPI000DC6EB0A|nr:cation diffusion facilitator family transporter [Pseudanabaena sp. ABRG5-3]BBC25239.1 cation diffusion facilitator family transporter [Pseudanabaena sp. ABRG5-3]
MPHQHSHKHHDHSHSGHSHSHHGHAHPAPANYSQAFIIGFILNVGFVVTEFGFGFFSNSVSLIADAAHNLSDVLGLVISWVAILVSRRKPSSRYTYGWRKSSILATFLNAIFLLVTTGGIVWEAIQRLLEPSSKVEGGVIIVVAAIGIVINTATALLFASGSKGDLNIRAVFLHMAADALVSLGVVLAGIAIIFTKWFWLDPIFSLVISALIIFSTWELLKDSFNLAIDGVPNDVDERAVRTYLSELDGVTGVHDLHIWNMSTVETALTAHLVMPTGHSDEFLAQISRELQQHFAIAHSTLQIETGDRNHPCVLETKCQAP